ncbi:MAG: PD-(D/E)XK nuclease-like domain-containing protein [Mycolicibacterium frederiksbergense]|nr:PD-(D/E)XK nuclease-like domain-containing protein [Mycolicibacterium frederiksbergense]
MTAVLTEIPAEDGVYAGVPEELYHSDRDSLSSSGARTILWSSPAAFHEEQTTPREPKAAYDFGHLVHLLILGEGGKIEVLDPAVHGLTKDGKPAANPASTAMWKEAEAAARERGATPVTIAEFAKAKEMADQVLLHPVAGALLSQGDAEITGYWTDPETGVRLRWRTDWLHQGRSRLIIVDYKSTKSAKPAAFHRSCSDYGYHQQEDWYCEGIAANGLCDDPLFLFIAQEKTRPYLVSVHESHPDDIVRAHGLNRRAINTYAECRETGKWPGYGDGIHLIEHPRYAVIREEAMIA